VVSVRGENQVIALSALGKIFFGVINDVMAMIFVSATW